MTKFPTTIKTNNKIKAVQNAMPSALEGIILDESVALSELVLALAVLSMIEFSLTPMNIRNNGSLASFKHNVFKSFLAEQKLLRL